MLMVKRFQKFYLEHATRSEELNSILEQ
uniref:Uncharacterized protein n=1 Tax=Anguilla anguilla TaxID=7936 RepID=A0A0E9QJH6_ANGAN